MKQVNVGLLGFGTIGTGVVKVLQEKKEQLAQVIGTELNLKWVCDIDLTRARAVKMSKKLLTNDANQVLTDPEVDIIIELIGGIHPALEYILTALQNKKHVVTANKALLAEHGKEIFSTAAKVNKSVYFEGSVGGGIPIINAINVGLAANRINSVFGILNGTTNYILTRMAQEGADYQTVLKDAQQLGFAEADPTLDVSGMDAAHKLVILASLAFQTPIELKEVLVEGITEITASDIQYAREFGYVIKLLAIGKRTEQGIEVRVHPTMLPKDNLLTSVNGVYNAILVEGDTVGTTLFYGRGAGMMPTASAVISDVITLSKQILCSRVNEKCNIPSTMNFSLPIGKKHIPIKPIPRLTSKYYLRFSALDQPGVLAAISGILSRYKISISAVIQKGRKAKDVVPIVMMTHEAMEASIQQALVEIDKLPVIKRKSILIRVED
ncbi:MAG: homoserine dehydrogenase [bacterium]|nr:homoserine dehydrogenase [bacterium]